MPPFTRILLGIVAAASFTLAVATVTIALAGGRDACREREGPQAPRTGETVRRETSWLPPGTRCTYGAADGSTRTVAPSPFIFIINLGLGALLLLLMRQRVADQVRRRRGASAEE